MKKVHKNSKEKFSISIFLYESICNVKLFLAVNAYQWARFSYFMLLYMINNRRHTESEINKTLKVFVRLLQFSFRNQMSL